MFVWLLALPENRYKLEKNLIKIVFYTVRERDSKEVTSYMKI